MSSENMVVDIVAPERWVHAQELLEQLLENNAPASFCQVLGPHRSGKSTEFVNFVTQLGKRARLGATILYVVGTTTEADGLATSFDVERSHCGSEPITLNKLPKSGQFSIMNYVSFLDGIEDAACPLRDILLDDTIIFLDDVLCYTVPSEITRGLVHKLLNEDDPPLIVVFGLGRTAPQWEEMADGRASHTIEAEMGAEMEEGEVRDKHQWQTFDPANPEEIEPIMIEVLKNGSNVATNLSSDDIGSIFALSGCSFPVLGLDEKSHPPLDLSVRTGTVFCLGPEAFSSPPRIPNIGLVVLIESTWTPAVDLRTSRLVNDTVLLSREQLLVHHQYDGVVDGSAKLYCTYTAEQIDQMPKTVRHHIYNGQLMMFALSFAAHQPGRAPWAHHEGVSPDQTWLSASLSSEAYYRLELKGLVKPHEAGWRLTADKGQRAWDMRRLVGEDDFNAACLLAGIATSLPHRLRYVLIRLACIAARVDFVVVAPGRDLPQSQQLQAVHNHVRGFGVQQIHKGWLWVSLGLWEAARSKTQNFSIPQMNNNLRIGDEATVDFSQAQIVYLLSRRIEKAFGLPELDEDLLNEPLSSDEMKTIESHLMWAWSDMIVLLEPDFVSNSLLGRDTRSWGPVALEDDFSLLNDAARNFKAAQPDQAVSYVGLAQEFHVTADGELTASLLTLFELEHLREIEEKSGLKFIQALAARCTLPMPE